MQDAAGAAPIDRYVVIEYLSEGGMGAIYLGKKLGAGGFEKEVVLKQLLPEFTQQPEFIDLFLREARLSANLDHANIIHTIDLVTAGSEYFIVMEYLAGADLRTLIKRTKRTRSQLSPAAGIYIAREILSALAYAHTKSGPDGKPLRLIHRDVSPSNILVSHSGEVKLTDFGIAKASTHNSVFYRVKGKVGYMSPEQAKNEPLDHRSDLYSMAVVLYEMVTGERLFVSAGLTSTPEQIYSQPIPMLSRKVSGLPADLDKVMLRALAIDPGARYQTAGELQEALLRVAHKHGLLMSAPELAAHLRKVVGPHDKWRELDAQDGTAGPRHGTEVYDMGPEGTDQLSVDDLDDDDFGSGSALSSGMSAMRGVRAKTSITHLSRLQGIELTSMINLAELQKDGGKPLVDLDALERALEMPDDVDDPHALSQVADLPEPPALVTAKPSKPAKNDDRAPRMSSAMSDLMTPRRRWGWILAVLVLLAAAAVAAAIGLSGPSVGPSREGGASGSPP